MNLIFNCSLGKLKFALFLILVIPQSVLAINIRGNGGFSVKYADGQIYPSDLFYRFNGWAPRQLKCGGSDLDWQDLVQDFIENSALFPGDKQSMLKSLEMIKNRIHFCTLDDFNRSDVEYTFIRKDFDSFRNSRIYKEELMAINFADLSENKIIDFCVNSLWSSEKMSNLSRAVLILHELSYVLMGTKMNPSFDNLAINVNLILDQFEENICRKGLVPRSVEIDRVSGDLFHATSSISAFVST